ncbi:MAG: histidine--tRNA ligase [Flavobacteriales bacterium]|nr:histidine--tRNA ligase [Flavobacteriales bacterium]
MAQKPSVPKGTRDFSPEEMLRRKYIFRTIEKVFQKYGFLPIETPAMENSETLTGKYGDEGDRLIFRVLNSGTFISNVTSNPVARSRWMRLFNEADEGTLNVDQYYQEALSKDLPLISNKALRYDLTVPFARYVVQHQHEITFPFKRYQIQPVWRADRPQKGRYREFYQCDADVIGSTSMLNEAELIAMVKEVFERLGLEVQILVNHRKVLAGLAKLCRVENRFIEFLTILDKYDKVGLGILELYADAGFSRASIERIELFLTKEGVHWSTPLESQLFAQFTTYGIDIGLQGLKEMNLIQDSVDALLGSNPIGHFSSVFSLARGLDYYTGAIFEVKAAEGSLQSSICGGGRYDDLTGIFGLKGVSGVGISFGADRIYDVLMELGKFPEQVAEGTRLLFVNFGDREAAHALPLLRKVREAGIAAELYPDAAKLKKQFAYADAKGIPYVATMGSEEIAQGIVSVKDLRSGEQKAWKADDLLMALEDHTD